MKPHIVDLYKNLPQENGVYFLYNTNEKKYYIGMTVRKNGGIRGRVKDHTDRLNNHRDTGQKLQDAWDRDNTCWVSGVLELTEEKGREQYYIQKFNAVEDGYNGLYPKKLEVEGIEECVEKLKEILYGNRLYELDESTLMYVINRLVSIKNKI